MVNVPWCHECDRPSGICECPTLEELLKKAAQHVMTPQEVWDQRVSFVYGQLMESNVTREEVEKRATETYGPRPS